MWRQLIHNFENGLCLQNTKIFIQQFRNIKNLQKRNLFTQLEHLSPKANAATNTLEKKTTTTTGAIKTKGAGQEIDHIYVQPYRVENETGIKANNLKTTLRQYFRLSDSEAQNILSDESVYRAYRTRDLTESLQILCREGVSKFNFIEYPWILAMDTKRLKHKLDLIKMLDLKDINHFVPFLRLTIPRLSKLVNTLNENTPNENRIYYMSKKLKISPSIVSKYLSKRLFILEMPFEVFEQNLQYMLDYNVSGINILKDLWAFRYTPKSIQIRLERARSAKKDKIMPWMVRCPEPILQRSLKLSLDELRVLGKNASVVEYIADRLEFNVSEAKAIMDKHPQVYTVRVTKIKEVLDFLLNEAGFTRLQIAQVPRILCHSLRTTKERLEELKSYGCRPSTLVIVCRSKREYEKFLQSWRATSTKHTKELKEANS